MPGFRYGLNARYHDPIPVRVAGRLRSTQMSRSRNSARSWRFASTTVWSSASACDSYPPQSSLIVSSADPNLERTTGEGDFNFCAFQRCKQPKRPSKKDRIRRQKQIVRKAQEARNHYSRPRMRNTCVFKGECKRRSAGSKKATYISQADTLKLSHDQLVDKVLMRMTP